MNPPGLHGTKVARAFEDRAALRGDMRSRLTVQTGPVVLTCGMARAREPLTITNGDVMKKTAFAFAALLACGVAQADTLSKIKESAAVTMGVRESSGALSYTLGDGKYVGYHIEICERVVKAMTSRVPSSRPSQTAAQSAFVLIDGFI